MGDGRTPKCSFTQASGPLTTAAHAGTNTIHFDGVVSQTSRLGLGSYTVTATAQVARLASTPATLSFTIVKH